MEVKVNVISEMKKLRNTSYQDKLTWIDELVQNCQRSGATHIKVTVGDEYNLNKIIIEDNGHGCTDPQVIFEKSSSNWSETVTNSESPFGEGFFSTMMIADNITVSSIGFTANFDVKKMFEENTVQAIDVKPNRKKSGFTVTLTDILPEYRYSTNKIIKRFKDVGKYIKRPSMSINGKTVNYEGLNPKEKHQFMHRIDNEMFRGWIHPYSFYRDGLDDPTIKIFAHSRLVTETQDFYGVNGVINMYDNAVNLRSPDRKAIIEDEKYQNFTDLLNAEIKSMYEKVVKKGSDEDIKVYEYYIEKHLGVQDYKKYIRFKLLSDEKKDAEQDDTDDNNTSEDVLNEQDDQYNNYDDYVETEPNVTDMPVFEYEDTQVETNMTCNKNAIACATVEKQTGVSIDNLKYGFYLNHNELMEYRDEIDIATYYNIPIIELRNKLETTCIHEYGHIRHISDFTNTTRLNVDFTNMKPKDEPETRAYKVLNALGSMLLDRSDIFIIADTKCQKILSVGDQDHIIDTVDTFATAYDSHVYINRKHMKGYHDLKDTTSALTDADKKFILMNLETIAHELSHLVYGTQDNTKEHFKQISLFMQKIIRIMYERNYTV